MNGYEYSSSNPFTLRGNGSAYELLNNPAMFGSPFTGTFTGQQNPTQQNPWFTAPTGLNPGQQQTFTQPSGSYFPQTTNPGWQQPSNPFQQQPTQFTQQPWQTHPNQPSTTGNWPWAQQQFGFGTTPGTFTQTPGVYTTKAVDINLTVPAQTVLGRHPAEIQQYVLQVIVPTLIDALTKRGMAHDVGQSVSFELRGGCVVRVSL